MCTSETFDFTQNLQEKLTYYKEVRHIVTSI